MTRRDQIAASQQMLEVLFPDLFLEAEDLDMESVVAPVHEHVDDGANAVAGPSAHR